MTSKQIIIAVIAITISIAVFSNILTGNYIGTGNAVKDASAYTARLVRCVNGNDAFESMQNSNTCEVAGQRYVGPLGYVFNTRVDGTHLLVRCMVNGREAMISSDENCENSGRGAIKSNKFVGQLGYVYDRQEPGTIPLYRCLRGADHFASVQSNCEGARSEGVLGYIMTAIPLVCEPSCTSQCGGEDDGCNRKCPLKAEGTQCTIAGQSSTCDGKGSCTLKQTCADSDGGKNVLTKGSAAGIDANARSSFTAEDSCMGTDTLIEYACDNNNLLKAYHYTCPDSSCNDGVCSSQAYPTPGWD